MREIIENRKGDRQNNGHGKNMHRNEAEKNRMNKIGRAEGMCYTSGKSDSGRISFYEIRTL